MATLLGVACYVLLIAALLRLFRSAKRSDLIAERLLHQYSSDGEE